VRNVIVLQYVYKLFENWAELCLYTHVLEPAYKVCLNGVLCAFRMAYVFSAQLNEICCKTNLALICYKPLRRKRSLI